MNTVACSRARTGRNNPVLTGATAVSPPQRSARPAHFARPRPVADQPGVLRSTASVATLKAVAKTDGRINPRPCDSSPTTPQVTAPIKGEEHSVLHRSRRTACCMAERMP